MADVRDGVGVYLSVYLLTVRDWQPGDIGIVIAAPGIVGVLVQTPAGALIDRTRHKLLLLIVASVIIALCCLAVVLTSGFMPILMSQAVVGLTQSVYAPCVAAVTLGIGGHAALLRRIGRNESCNHLGNMLAAIIAGLLGRYVSYEAIFYFSIAQCLLLVAAVLLIREEDIDHDLARGAGGPGDGRGRSEKPVVESQHPGFYHCHGPFPFGQWRYAAAGGAKNGPGR